MSSSSDNSDGDGDSSATKTPPYYSYEERILIGKNTNNDHNDHNNHHQDDNDSISIRLEFMAEWTTNNNTSGSGAGSGSGRAIIVHPFAQLQQRLFPKDDDEHHDLDVLIQISSRAMSHQFVNNNNNNNNQTTSLQMVPTLTGRRMTGPSGFWMRLMEYGTSSSDDNDDDSDDTKTTKAWIDQWIQQGLITTPILANNNKNKNNVQWDVIMEPNHHHKKRQQQQLILPSNGQGWSADALQQSLASTTIIATNNDLFFGRSAMDWSNLLVQTEAHSKTMWWHLKKKKKATNQDDDNNNGGGGGNSVEYSFNFGLEYTSAAEMEREYVSSLLSLLGGGNDTMGSPSSFLGPRHAYSVLPPARSETTEPYRLQSIQSVDEIRNARSSSSPVTALKIDQVLRRPGLDRGRLETWIETSFSSSPSSLVNDGCDGSLFYRQVLPPFLTPSWQTLDISSTSSSRGNDDDDDDDVVTSSSVEWLDDGTAILTVLWDKKKKKKDQPSPSTSTVVVVVSLEYTAAYLTMDDFPGDPNRGRELPPGMVQCNMIMHNNDATATAASDSLLTAYSSSMLILPPVPDMSMPFNVLSLTCSLYAYLIGTILIILTKKGSERVLYKLHPEKKPISKVTKLKERIKAKVTGVKERIKEKLLTTLNRRKRQEEEEEQQQQQQETQQEEETQTGGNE